VKCIKNGIKELHPSKYGWKGVCLSVCLSDLERKLNYSGCTTTDLYKNFQDQLRLVQVIFGWGSQISQPLWYSPGPKQPLSSKSIYSLSLYPTKGDIPFWKPQD